MDVDEARPYVGSVNLLLLLSALLSALTGMQVGARAPQVVVAVSQASRAVSVASVSRVSVAGRPAVAMPSLLALASAGARTGWRLAAVQPLFASRRRE